MTSWFRITAHEDAPALAATGLWQHAADLPHPHGQWSVLMQWIGSGNPPSNPRMPNHRQDREEGRG